MSDKATAIDCLASAEAELLKDAISISVAVEPDVREMLVKMQLNHMHIQGELLDLAVRRGWRRIPGATDQVIHHVAPTTLDL